MNELVLSLKKSITNQNWYASLLIALILPDICSKLEFPSVITSVRYPQWFNLYRDDIYIDSLSGGDCYSLRCSYMHEGNNSIEHQSSKDVVDKFSFSPQGSHILLFENIYVGSKDDGKTLLHISVEKFCEDMILSVEKWLKKVENDSEIKDAMNNLIEIQVTNQLYGGAVKIS